MKKVSFWASSHISAARILIVFINIILIVLSAWLGVGLQGIGMILPSQPIYLTAMVLCILALGVYSARPGYFQQKACDCLLPLCGCLVILTGVNNAGVVSSTSKAYGSNISSPAPVSRVDAAHQTKKVGTGGEGKLLKKWILKKVKKIEAAQKNNDLGKAAKTKQTLLIILSVIVLLGLAALLGVLVCNIACNSTWLAASAVGVFGLAGLIWAFIAVLKRIKQGPKRPKDAKEE